MPLIIKFKVSKRSVRDRLTLLQQKYKAKMTMEEAASGLDCEETKLDKALEEIIEKERAANDARGLQDDNKKAEKAATEEQRNRAVERLGETKKRNAEKEDEQAQTARKGRRSTSEAVQFLKEKSERESVLRKEDLELRRKELSQEEDMKKMLAQQQLFYPSKSLIFQCCCYWKFYCEKVLSSIHIFQTCHYALFVFEVTF